MFQRNPVDKQRESLEYALHCVHIVNRSLAVRYDGFQLRDSRRNLNLCAFQPRKLVGCLFRRAA
ncbi:MAG: hypothetical protein WC421_06745 [Elusimicrobiales bacterium]